ncbi:MAG: nucleoside triphosphate pyrophosphohydrolase family protein [Candidatus Bathyarchaeota archaeon]|nr:nucleoside triphosphate pyrophosphohydrolase family protein [Candidatus Bathyarchaeota archaeon]
MSLDQYQRLALETALFPTDKNLSYLTLALCGEVGEVAEKVKKVMRDKGGQFYAPDMAAIALELGDAMWYIANIAKFLGYGLSDIAKLNIEKIQGRIERGTLHGSGDER